MRIDAEAERALGQDIILWLVSVTSEGQPQASPVWFLWEDGSFLIFSQPGKPKLRNIEANPRVSVHLRGTEDGGEIATFDATAEILRDAPPADRVPGYVDKYRAQIRENGWTLRSFAEDYSQPIRVTPTAARIW
jgi:PPOX class probable F420-dependent enzyme